MSLLDMEEFPEPSYEEVLRAVEKLMPNIFQVRSNSSVVVNAKELLTVLYGAQLYCKRPAHVLALMAENEELKSKLGEGVCHG